MKYKHNKTGNIYIFMFFAINATNAQDGEQLVIYKSTLDNQMYARNEKEFFKKFTRLVA